MIGTGKIELPLWQLAVGCVVVGTIVGVMLGKGGISMPRLGRGSNSAEPYQSRYSAGGFNYE